MKQVPFYANRPDNLSCMLASYRSVLEYFTGRQHGWRELEIITGFQSGKAAWTVKTWTYLATRGFDIRMIEGFDYKRYMEEGEAYLQNFFSPEEFQWQIQKTNLLEIKPLLPEFLEHTTYEKRSPNLHDIDTMLHDGYLVTVQLNSNALNEVPGYNAHMIVVYDKAGEDFVAHDPGLPPREARHIKPDLLYKAMGGDNNTVEVTGIKLESK